jgi:hypothetical protein
MTTPQKERKMRTLPKILILTLVAALVIPALAMAQGNNELSRDEACKILGNCADDAVSTAEKMRVQCADMMKIAAKLMNQGMQIKTRGQMWTDQDMVGEGDGMLARGKKMMEEAKKMDEQCKLIIESAKASKRNAERLSKTETPNHPKPRGDHSPDL